jgi:hypothetical protein
MSEREKLPYLDTKVGMDKALQIATRVRAELETELELNKPKNTAKKPVSSENSDDQQVLLGRRGKKRMSSRKSDAGTPTPTTSVTQAVLGGANPDATAHASSTPDAPIFPDATTVDTGVDTSMAENVRRSQLASALGELPDTDTPEVTALKAEGAQLLAKKGKLTDDEVKEFEEKVRAMLDHSVPSNQPLGTVDPIKRDISGATSDTAQDPNSDAVMIALRREKLDQKERVNSLFDKLIEKNTDESMELAREGLRLLVELNIQPDEAKVKAFEEKAKAILEKSEQKELFELHGGDEFVRTVDGKTEGIRITRLDGDRVDVHLKTNFKDGSKSDETFGTTIQKLQRELRDKSFARGSSLNFFESTRVDINLDSLTAPDATFDVARAFQPLGLGEQATYKGNRGLVTIERDGLSGLYWITDEGVDNAGPAIYSEEDVRNNAELEKWQRVETAPKEPNPDLRGRDPRNYDELYEGDVWIKTLPDGSTRIAIVSHDLSAYGPKVDVETTVIKGSDPGEMTVRSILVDELMNELRGDGYILEEAGTGPKIEVPKSGEESKETDDSAKASEKIIEDLITTVGEMRLDYVTTDYKQNSAWQKIRRFFGKNLSEESSDSDTESARGRYERALMNLQEAQLALIKASNLSPEALRERMAGMLRYFKYDEQIKLAETRNQVKIENLKFSSRNPEKETSMVKVGRELVNGLQRGVTLAEQIGRFYNKRSRVEKFALAGVALGAGLFGGAAVAGGLVGIRRALSTAGLAVTIDTAVLTRQDNKRLKKMEEEQANDLKILEQNKEHTQYDFELLDNFLKRDIKLSDEKFQARKHQDIIRRSAVWGASVAGMLGISYGASHFREWLPGGRSAAEQAEELERLMRERGIKPPGAGASAPVIERASVAATPASASSAPTTAFAPERAPSAPGAATPAVAPKVELASTQVVKPEIASLQKVYEVTGADGKRGLWGILDNRLPEGFKGDKNRAIQFMQNAMREKLDAMSPAERAQLGFPKGLPDSRVNLDFIKPGDKIDFGALLSPQEIQDALDGKSVGAPIVPNVSETLEATAKEVSKVVTAASSDLSPAELDAAMKGAEDEMIGQDRVQYGYTPEEQKALKLAEDQMIADELAKDRITTASLPGQSYDDVRNAYTAKEFAASQAVEAKAVVTSAYEQAPVEVKREMMLQMTGDIRKSVFLTPQLMADTRMNAPFDYTINRGAMGYVQMGRITERFSELHSGRFMRFNRDAFPLHPSQVDQVVRLVSLAQDPRFFGTAGLPRPVENVDQYTRRIAHLALTTGKEREFFSVLVGRRNSII